MTTPVIAVHKLRVSDPLAELEFSGRYRDDGSPIVRKAGRNIAPGDTYTPPTAAELEYLLNLGAVRMADSDDFTALEVTQSDRLASLAERLA